MKMKKKLSLFVASITTAVLLSGCGESEEEKFHKQVCGNNMKVIYNAMDRYQKNQYHFPAQGLTGINDLFQRRFIGEKDLVCPASKEKVADSTEVGGKITEQNFSYIYLGNEKLTTEEKPEFPLLMSRPQNHCKWVTIFSTGGMESLHQGIKEKSAVKILQKVYKNGEGFNPENWKIAIEEAAKWDKKNGL